MKEFAEKLKELRKSRGYSQSYVAGKLNLSQAGYAKYESDLAEPDMERLKKITEIFDISVAELLNFDTTNASIKLEKQKVTLTTQNGEKEFSLTSKNTKILEKIAKILEEEN